MKRYMYYLDFDPNGPGGDPDEDFSEELRKKGLRCPDGCGGLPARLEGTPVEVRYWRDPVLPVESAPRANGIQVALWTLLSPHLKYAIVGPCTLRTRDGDIVPIETYVSVYVPVHERICLRGVKKYDICKTCGAVRCRDFGVKPYLLADDVMDRPVIMSMSRGILVDDAMHRKLEQKRFRGLRFYKYEVIDEPRDGRPKSLDDWPELAKWRKRRRAR